MAQVLSHLGSGAVIAGHRVDQALGGPEIDSQPIWDEWNAKDPDAMVLDGLAADAALMDRLDALTTDERASFAVPLGPMSSLRRVHRVPGQRAHPPHLGRRGGLLPGGRPAGRGPDDRPPGRADDRRFAGKATGSIRTLEVATTGPDDRYSVQLTPDGVVVTPSEAHGPADMVLSAEALVRLVYGRLDPDHTPGFKGAEADLDELRRAFPGV